MRTGNLYYMIGSRQSGKTTRLIEEAAKTGATIACHSSNTCEMIMQRAKRLGIEITKPITYTEMMAYKDLENPIHVLIDDMELFLSGIISNKAMMIDGFATNMISGDKLDIRKL